MQKKSFDSPDDTMKPSKAKMEIVRIGNVSLMRSTFEPGWKWSVNIGQGAGEKTCGMHHLFCISKGNLKIVMADGSELEAGPSEVVDIPPGHDAWVMGNEPVVGIDLGSAFYVNPKLDDTKLDLVSQPI